MTSSNNVTLNVKAGLNKIFITVLGLLHFSVLGIAQNRESADSLVRLIEAVSAHLLEEDGVSYRKVIGPATFLHNNTYLKCDTALWNVSTNIIEAYGNIKVTQENTVLVSDSIKYDIPANLAMFRGSLVELYDNEGNILNTNYLNYNTRDSVATFYFGASMKSNDGKIIESENGMYVTAEKKFTFEDNVQIFTDSVLISSDGVDYLTQLDVVQFNDNTVAWRDDNILCANSGNFNRPENIFTFDKDGYILTKDQELWADLIRYYRNTGNADLYNNVQVLDTVQSSICLADRVVYSQSERKIHLTDNPAVAFYTLENDIPDTLFFAADTIVYTSKYKYQVDSAQILVAAERVRLSGIDPIAIHDKERREARAAKKNNVPAPQKPDVADTLASVQDTLVVEGTLSVVTSQKDTSEVVFIDAWNSVRFFRSDVQGLSDSLVYTGLDSMARFYKNPVMWQDRINQFSADSIQGVIKNGALHKIDLLTNAFIAVQEDSVHYNQIKSSEMAAYFSNNELYRFDALGGVSAIFYMQEDNAISLMDQEECKMLTARIKDNQIQRTRSIGELKQNVFPVFALAKEQKYLKGFLWRGEERPASRYDITGRGVKQSTREKVRKLELPDFIYTHKYFPDAMPPIMDYRESISNSLGK